MKQILFYAIANVLLGVNIAAQNTCVLFDRTNNAPVAYANVYKSEEKTIIGTVSDENGSFTIDFEYKQLNISHINYESVVIDGTLNDTIYLVPKVGILNEVVVKSGEPSWIRPFMKRFIRENKKRYSQGVIHFDYDYVSRNVSDSSGYWFESDGKIRIQNDNKGIICKISPNLGIIHYKDSTAGCDFSNMKRMLYNDFVDLLDDKFLKKHSFMENDAFVSENKNIIQLLFKSTKYGDGDKGLITVDTARCLILSAKRETGLDYNLNTNTDGVTRSSIRLATGYRYTRWFVSIETLYRTDGENAYPEDYKYKMLICSESDKEKYKGTRFESVESSICLKTSPDNKENKYIELPKPWYMKIIVSKEERLNEEKLQAIPKKYVLY
ncbi:MAG: carboxypeptidase-like regulatory domain-containing protein [Bacteroidales bacterium]|nr:carboxypeptidase-like regulatory domain-containing protein [Bacteroidales bacterium]